MSAKMEKAMPEKKKPEAKKRSRKKSYATKPNAVHITVYDPQGSPVPNDVLLDAIERVQDVAKEHNLLIATATT